MISHKFVRMIFDHTDDVYTDDFTCCTGDLKSSVQVYTDDFAHLYGR